MLTIRPPLVGRIVLGALGAAGLLFAGIPVLLMARGHMPAAGTWILAALWAVWSLLFLRPLRLSAGQVGASTPPNTRPSTSRPTTIR